MRKVQELEADKWDLEDGVVSSSSSSSPTETDVLTRRNLGDNMHYLLDPFTRINETKNELQKIGAIHIIKKHMRFSDDAFERKFIDYVEGRLRSRMTLIGVCAFMYGMYSLFFYNFFEQQTPLLSRWDHASNVLYNISWMITVILGVFTLIVCFHKGLFVHSVEVYLQYSTIFVITSCMFCGNMWRVTRLTGETFTEAFPSMKDMYPDSDLVMLLSAIVLYLAIVADMRFRRLIWICLITWFSYTFTVLYYRLPDFSKELEEGEDTAAVPGRLQCYILATQLTCLYVLGMFGKMQLELLQRQNFLELELASKRIDVLEKTIHAMDDDKQPHTTRLEQTHKKLKDAERIVEKIKLISAVSGGNIHQAELGRILTVLQETEKTLTILDFQKTILLGPIKTGHQYREEEVMEWIQQTVDQTGVGPSPVPMHVADEENLTTPPNGAVNSLTLQQLGISAVSLMKRIGVEWDLNLREMEHSLAQNQASHGLSAFQLCSRQLLSPFRKNILLNVSQEIINAFSQAVDEAYLDVPFHSAYHAASVAHHAHILLDNQLTGIKRHLSGIDCLALTVASLCHCVSHFGRSNTFLIETRHDLATRYNDQQVMENFHAFKTFEIIRSSKMTNITSGFSKREERRFRNRVIQLILATGCCHSSGTEHFQNLSELRLRLMGSQLFVDPELIETDKRIGLIAIIKAADLGFHTLQPNVNVEWMQALAEEYAQQGDDERALGLAISPMCDRTNQDIHSMASGLITILAIPYYDEIVKLVKRINPGAISETKIVEIYANLINNHTLWKLEHSKHRNGSFDVFVPMPRIPTTTDSQPSSPPALVPINREEDILTDFLPDIAISKFHDDGSESDDEPPTLPFNLAHT